MRRQLKILRRAQCASRNRNRCGASLIEVLVVISMLGVMFTLTGTTLHMLLRSEKVVSQSIVTERTVARLANLFREDVHRAESALEVGDAGVSELRLNDENGVRVRYLVTKGGLTRALVDHQAIIARDDFYLPECQVRFARDPQANSGLLSLLIERPAVVLQKNSQATRPFRILKIQACLDQKRRLLVDDSSTNGKVKIAHSAAKEE